MFTEKQLQIIFDKTGGHCHFCGDVIIFKKYGIKNIKDIDGVWEADHIHQKGKGGSKSIENCLPACYKCNRLRWHRCGEEIRELLFLGLVVKKEVKNKTECGKEIIKLKHRRLAENEKRRRKLK